MSPVRRWIWNDVVFACVAVALVALTYTHAVDRINTPLAALTYRGAAWLLQALGVSFTSDDAHRSLAAFPFIIRVDGLCSGLRGLALFAAVLLMLPYPRPKKAIHFAVGIVALMLMNVARIAHLFVIGAGGSRHFNLYHEWIWPSAVVGLVLLYRLVMLIVTRRRPDALVAAPEVAHALSG